MKTFGGKVLFLDRADINTDEIIPAKYLTEITKMALKPYLLEDLSLENFNPETDIEGKKVVVTRENFGCGSSREHAPWALEVNDINVVIAPSYARIFRQNMFNCGMMAIEMDEKTIDQLFVNYSQKNVEIQFDLDNRKMTVTAEGKAEVFDFQIGGYDESLIKAGGWLEYADAKY